MTDTFTLEYPQLHIVAYRCLALWTLLSRMFDELKWSGRGRQAAGQGNLAHIERLHWLQSSGVNLHLTSNETKLLTKPFGTWSDTEKTTCQWENESLRTLTWALSWEDDLPRFSNDDNTIDVLKHRSIYENVKGFCSGSALLPLNVLVMERNIQLAYARRFHIQLAYLRMNRSTEFWECQQ